MKNQGRRGNRPAAQGPGPAREEAAGGEGESAYLFTTKTCPNCRLAKSFLDQAGVTYRVVDAEENQELVENYGVCQAPTLVVIQGGKISQFANASNIKKYTEELC
jgi:ribonucleoside-triphosphate reductase